MKLKQGRGEESGIYSNRPVRIPDLKGKISYKKQKDSRYVMYETGRRYDKYKKYNVVSRICIGIQIPARPEYMLPNENYFRMITEGERVMNENEQEALDEFEFERAQAFMLRDFFEQMYYEFQYQSRRQPNTILNEYKVRKLNKILEPLKEMMKEEPGGGVAGGDSGADRGRS